MQETSTTPAPEAPAALTPDEEARKPTVPEVLPLVQTVYAHSAVGCCLHIVLDDHNVEDGHVKFCLERAHEAQHHVCITLAEKLLRMSKTQRLRLAKHSNKRFETEVPDEEYTAPAPPPHHGTYQVGMVPAVRWVCTCNAQNLNLDPRAVKAAHSRNPIQDKCPNCGALAYIRPQLIIERATPSTGKVILK